MPDVLASTSDPAAPWTVPLLITRGHARNASERRAISRDVAAGSLHRLGHGAYVERVVFAPMSPEDKHIVRMRAFAATCAKPVVFSHWSAAVPQGLPVLRARLGLLHITTEDDDARHIKGVVTHRFSTADSEVVRFHELLVTGVGRTVVDLAGSAPLEEGAMAADGALFAGVPRALLEEAAVMVGPRRSRRRIDEVVAFAHPGAESAGESRLHVSMWRLGMEVPELQRPIRLRDGASAYLDEHLRSKNVGIELDGRQKYLDASMAPDGTAAAVLREKDREDEVRLELDGLARVGWVQAGDLALLRGVLARLDVHPPDRRPPFEAWCEAARAASPRFLPRAASWRV